MDAWSSQPSVICSWLKGRLVGLPGVEVDGVSVDGAVAGMDVLEDAAMRVVNTPALNAALSCPDFKSKMSEPLLQPKSANACC